MKSKFIMIFFLLSAMPLNGQESELLEVFEDQVVAFNNRDVDRLVQNVSEDFKWYYITSDTLLLEVEGRDAFRKSMVSYFAADLDVHSTIEDRVIDGRRVSFREVVSYNGKNGKRNQAAAMGIYEIRKGKIHRVWYFSD